MQLNYFTDFTVNNFFNKLLFSIFINCSTTADSNWIFLGATILHLLVLTYLLVWSVNISNFNFKIFSEKETPSVQNYIILFNGPFSIIFVASCSPFSAFSQWLREIFETGKFNCFNFIGLALF